MAKCNQLTSLSFKGLIRDTSSRCSVTTQVTITQAADCLRWSVY